MELKVFLKTLLMAVLFANAACGGGGGNEPLGGNNPPSGNNPPADDTNPPTVDRTPDDVSFTGFEDAYPGKYYDAKVTISGLTDGERVPAQLTDTTSAVQLLINDVEQEDEAGGTVANGDVVTVRLEAARARGGAASTAFSSGEPPVSAVFTVNTKTSDDPPMVAIDFPPMRATTTTAGTFKVRGRVKDDFDIEGLAITVNGAPADLDVETGVWTANYLVMPGIQTIRVVAEDSTGQTAEDSVELEHVETFEGYSLGEGQPIGMVNAVSVDPSSDDVRLLVAADNGLVKIDATTGDRTLLPRPPYYVFGGDYTAMARLDVSRALVANSDPSGWPLGLAIYDLDTTEWTHLSLAGDGRGTDDLFPAHAMTHVTDGNVSVAYVATIHSEHVGAVNADNSGIPGSRGEVLHADYRSTVTDIDYDPIRKTHVVSSCHIYWYAGRRIDEPQDDFCFIELDIDQESGMAYSVNTMLSSTTVPSIFRLDLAAATAERLQRASDPALGPVLDAGYDLAWDVDFDGQVGYLALTLFNPDQDFHFEEWPRFYAIDLLTGYRVVISMEPR